jgi:hypothetical protein
MRALGDKASAGCEWVQLRRLRAARCGRMPAAAVPKWRAKRWVTSPARADETSWLQRSGCAAATTTVVRLRRQVRLHRAAHCDVSTARAVNAPSSHRSDKRGAARQRDNTSGGEQQVGGDDVWPRLPASGSSGGNAAVARNPGACRRPSALTRATSGSDVLQLWAAQWAAASPATASDRRWEWRSLFRKHHCAAKAGPRLAKTPIRNGISRGERGQRAAVTGHSSLGQAMMFGSTSGRVRRWPLQATRSGLGKLTQVSKPHVTGHSLVTTSQHRLNLITLACVCKCAYYALHGSTTR